MRFRVVLSIALLLGWAIACATSARPAAAYPINDRVRSCPDPSIIRGQQPGDRYWYLYCTTSPLNDEDRDVRDNYRVRLVLIQRSLDLVNWEYVGEVFSERPSWVAGNATLWAPDIQYLNGRYYLYYTASRTSLPGGGRAIGVATSDSPTGPWTDSGQPVVEPQAPRWVIDPFVLADDDGQLYIFYGSYAGGISARKLSPDGLRSDPATETPITVADRYEGAFVRKRGGYYYLFVSATNCCNGPLTGYSVFAGRSKSLLGPYTDREGVPLLAGRVGGTPVISMNGNRWVGPGHNVVFTDFAGQYWFLYHALDRTEPYFAGPPRAQKRPVHLDPLDWVDGWPTVRGGLWASERREHLPAAQPGALLSRGASTVRTPQVETPGELIAPLSDEFAGGTLGSRWGWVRPPSPQAFGLGDGTLRFETQTADLHIAYNTAPVLTEPTPEGDYIVETRLRLNLPAEGCCYNHVQAGLVIYGDDDNYLKLTHVAINGTRQTEFAKEVHPVPPGYPRYGNTVVGPPDEWTYLRIVRRLRGEEEHYTAYTSRDGATWTRGGTWTHSLGRGARIGLVAMGGAGFTANFDYVRVYRVHGVHAPSPWSPALRA